MFKHILCASRFAIESKCNCPEFHATSSSRMNFFFSKFSFFPSLDTFSLECIVCQAVSFFLMENNAKETSQKKTTMSNDVANRKKVVRNGLSSWNGFRKNITGFSRSRRARSKIFFLWLECCVFVMFFVRVGWVMYRASIKNVSEQISLVLPNAIIFLTTKFTLNDFICLMFMRFASWFIRKSSIVFPFFIGLTHKNRWDKKTLWLMWFSLISFFLDFDKKKSERWMREKTKKMQKFKRHFVISKWKLNGESFEWSDR